MDFYTHIKNRCIILADSAIISYVTYSIYSSCIVEIMSVVNSRSIIYLFWPAVPLVLCVPTAVYFVFLFMSAFFSRTLKPNKILHRGMNIALGYGVVVTVLGVVISIIIPFNLFSTGYVYCQGGGPFSGIMYTKNESVCEQVKIIWDSKDKGVKEIKELNDKLDAIQPHQ